MTKAEIRETVLALRREIDPERRSLRNMMVFERGHKHPAFQLAKRVHVYRSAPDEVDTMPMIEYAWGIGKEVFVPVTLPDRELRHVRVTRSTQWTVGSFGIVEPSDNDCAVDATAFGENDCIVVPVVAFDRECARIGYGGGYYDRFLAQSSAVCIGLAYECQRVSGIPIEPHDKRLDAIATEERWYKV